MLSLRVRLAAEFLFSHHFTHLFSAVHGNALKSNLRVISNGRIVGGQAVDISWIPHQVSILTSVPGGYVSICGGSIVNGNWIVTAAHCTMWVNQLNVGHSMEIITHFPVVIVTQLISQCALDPITCYLVE